MRQKYGQNFLYDKNIANKIVSAAEITSDDNVIEVGPGKGILTEIIASKAKEVIAVEIDQRLTERLRTRFSAYANVKIINQDFMSFAFEGQKKFNLVANLPYYMATAIIRKFLPAHEWEKAIVMVQKEVGKRITAKPGSKIYGALSLFCQYFADARILFSVSPGSFAPPPKVDSVVISLSNLFRPEPPKHLFELISLCFQQRRKTLLNALHGGFDVSKDELLKACKKACINPLLRPENLSLDNFKDLTFSLTYYRILGYKSQNTIKYGNN